jgi:hypothetical protein
VGRRHRPMRHVAVGDAAVLWVRGTGRSSGPLLRGEPTRRSTGHTRSSPFGAARSSVADSPSASPSHTGQSCCSSITGMRSCSSAISAFDVVVDQACLTQVWRVK